MQDIEALASRILLIGKGRLLLDGTLEDIRKRAADAGSDAEEASIDETLAVLYRQYDIQEGGR